MWGVGAYLGREGRERKKKAGEGRNEGREKRERREEGVLDPDPGLQ